VPMCCCGRWYRDYLLPTLAYVGGSAEVAYFGQGAVVYKALLGRVTPILPRFSATIVETKPQVLLERYGFACSDIFRGPERAAGEPSEAYAAADLQSAFDQAEASAKEISGYDSAVSGTVWTRPWWKPLPTPGQDTASVGELRSRAARAELRQSEVLGRHAELLSNALYPIKVLQEREIGGIYFAARQRTSSC